MENIEFSIDKFSFCDENINPNRVFKTEKVELLIFGDLMGAIYEGKVFSQEKAFDLICQNVNTKNLNKVIHSSIGPFYLVVIHNDTIKIYCSCSSPGLLYIQNNNKLIFSNNENKFYQNYFDKAQINEDELISHIISHPIFRRVPFKSLFNNISRCINGSYIEISKDLQTNTKLFIISDSEKFKSKDENPSLKKRLNEFSYLLENTLGLICKYYEKDQVVLYKSGGIDSSAILAALMNIKADFDCYHFSYWGTNVESVNLARQITNIAKKNLHIITNKKVDIEKIRKDAENNLNSIVGPQYLLFGSQKLENKDNKIIAVSGQNLDTLYYSDTFAPGSTVSGIKKIVTILLKFKYRFLYSYFFIKNYKNLFIKIYLKIIFKGKKDFSFSSYLKSILIPNNEHVIPYSNHNDRKTDINIHQKYKKNRIDHLYNLVVDTFEQKFNSKIEELNAMQKNHCLRVARWLRTVQNVPTNYHMASTDRLIKILPFTEGPMVKYFLYYKLSFYEMIYIKYLVKRYFKDYAQGNYSSFVATAKRKTYLQRFKKIKINIKIINRIYSKIINRIKKYNSRESQVPYDYIKSTKKVLKTLINENYSYLSSLFKDDPDCSDYIININKKIHDNNYSSVSKAELMEMCRMVNYELFLSNASKKSTINN